MKLETMQWEDGDKRVELLTPSLLFFNKMNPTFSLEKFADGSSWTSSEMLSRIQAIDAQFLIKVSRVNGDEVVITDRWSSIPIFYTHGAQNFDFEPSRSGAATELALFSIVLTRRLWGGMTITEESKKIPSGSVAILSPKHQMLKILRYHERRFEAMWRREEDQAEELASALKSVVSKIPDATLFLSGGLDSRILLAAGSGAFTAAQTIAFDERSRELVAASELCALTDTAHRKVILNVESWMQLFDEVLRHSRLGRPLHSLYLLLAESADLFVTGIALDYMFQGMYLVPSGAVEQFDGIDNLVLDLPCGNRYLSSDLGIKKYGAFEELVGLIQKDVARDRLESLSKNDALRTLMFDDPSMHYSYTDFISQSARRRVLVPAFTIELDALWQSYSSTSLLNKNLTINALIKLDKRLMKPKLANTNLPISWQKQDRIMLYIKNGIERCRSEPLLEHQKRTWPTQGWMASQLIKHFGREFFVEVSEELNYEWLTPQIIRQELDWFQGRTREKRFAARKCDREDSLFYCLSALLISRC